MTERRRALIVANCDYQDPVLRRLIAPAQDAKELARVLEDRAIGGFEVETLLNAKASVVSQAIETFFVFSEPKPDDLLLLYFSGHGVTDEEGQFYFATVDTQFVRQSVRRATAVGADFVDGSMRRSRSRREVLLLDCCHSGAFAESMRAKGEALPKLETRFQGKGRMVLTASTAAQFSLEGPSDTEAQPSVYTRILVQALETGEADRDGDGWVSLDELHDYLLDKVQTEAPQQTPTKSGYLEGRMYIARSPVVRPAKLPAELQSDLTSSNRNTRLGAIQDLDDLLKGDHPGLALAALEALQTCRDNDDSRRVGDAAGRCVAAFLQAKAAEQAEAARLERERLAAFLQAKAAEQAEAARLERERLEAERKATEQAEAARLERERLEAERKAAEQAEAARLECERIEAERKAAEKAEADRLKQRERLEAERKATEKVESERKKREQERVERERLEAERKATEKVEAERKKREQERVDRERLDAERKAAEKVEAERKKKEQERVERQRLEAEKALPPLPAVLPTEDFEKANEQRNSVRFADVTQPSPTIVARTLGEETKSRIFRVLRPHAKYYAALILPLLLGAFGVRIYVARPGTLRVTTNPQDASLSINGASIDGPPFLIERPSGFYRLLVAREGYIPRDERVQIGAGQAEHLDIELTPAPETGFEITSQPSDGLLWMDGQPLLDGHGQQATTSFHASGIAPGAHVIEIRGTPNFQDWRHEVVQEPSRMMTLYAELAPTTTTGDPTPATGRHKRVGGIPSRSKEPFVTLTKSDIVTAMKGVQPRVQACANEFGVQGTAWADISVALGGIVNSAVTGKFAGTPIGSCVEQAARLAKFPACRPESFPWPFTLSPSSASEPAVSEVKNENRNKSGIDQRKERDKIVDLNKQALLSYEASDFATARGLLKKALGVADNAGLLEDKMVARTYIHLGAVYQVGFHDQAEAIRNFTLAKRIRPEIVLTPSIETSDLKAAFDSAPDK